MQTIVTAQCGINVEEILNKQCKGTYLKHWEKKSNADSMRMVLNKGNKYAIYLLNPSKGIPKFEIKETINSSVPLKSEDITNIVCPFSTFEMISSKEENMDSYIFTVNKTAVYKMIFDFGDQKDACVLVALYFIEARK
jgi:hypothetical protein